MDKYPGQYNFGQIRTLQRRFSEWRQEQLGQESRLRALLLSGQSEITPLVDNLIGIFENEQGEAEQSH